MVIRVYGISKPVLWLVQAARGIARLHLWPARRPGGAIIRAAVTASALPHGAPASAGSAMTVTTAASAQRDTSGAEYPLI
jgi:hypothetical protein